MKGASITDIELIDGAENNGRHILKRTKAKKLLLIVICCTFLTACTSKDSWIDTTSYEKDCQYDYTAYNSSDENKSEDEVSPNKTTEKKTSGNEVEPNELIEESNYLTVDWTDFEILMRHSIEPEDSGRGWEFSIADVDFDGTLELLVTFAANHCGQNALYIYKQENGRVFSFADTNAVFGKYVMSDIDYKAISPYMDIDLLAAYKNQNNEYRYLSLDYSIFGGNECGDIGTVTLYETILDKQTAPVKLAEISYVLPEETVEMYFRGERIYDAEELKDQLDEYMEGYTELEIKYETATKSFSRDIVAQSDEYKAKELGELYKSLEELLAERKELEEAEKGIKENGTIAHDVMD